MKQKYERIINSTYDAFNTRAIDTALSFMHRDVHWPNGREGAYVYLIENGLIRSREIEKR